MRSYFIIASINAFLAVFLGAMGAHFLSKYMTQAGPELFKTGVQYHMWHSIALYICGFFSIQAEGNQKALKRIKSAGFFFTAGIILFSGMIYYLSIAGTSPLHFAIPAGGICFLGGWILLLINSFQIKKKN
jgi:uncharacterized membrane protein YgdD (TMEM256/DUF423 family)